LLVFVQIWIRWTLPRLRIDQVMATCLKYLVPISCFLFLGAVTWPLLLAMTFQQTTLFGKPLGERVPVSDRKPAPAHVGQLEPEAEMHVQLVHRGEQ
jgi:NADH-quinone oxidoreductase subunit H